MATSSVVSLRVTILWIGSSGGVNVAGCFVKACHAGVIGIVAVAVGPTVSHCE